jgi:hypothetical protein
MTWHPGQPLALETAPAATPGPLVGRAHLKWAQLLRQVFSLDALECPQCQTAMVVRAFISDPPVVRKILGHLKLPTTPCRHPGVARSPP